MSARLEVTNSRLDNVHTSEMRQPISVNKEDGRTKILPGFSSLLQCRLPLSPSLPVFFRLCEVEKYSTF
nr:hypothetical transcript [Hymenolepis microstoma]